MNILNKTGQKLLELKKEIGKDYPEIVRESMLCVLENMLKDRKISENTYEIFINENKTYETFSNYLLSHSEYQKTAEEIAEELCKFNQQIREYLQNRGVSLVNTEFSENPEHLTLTVTKIFTLEDSFIMEFFGATEKDMPKLMKKGGFVEVFVSLRLTKILSDMENFFSQSSDKAIKIHYSLPYRSKSVSGFSIELFMEIPAEKYENMDKKETILLNLYSILDKSDSSFVRKIEI